jgi:nucleoside-diphosphate-sugar epimerase
VGEIHVIKRVLVTGGLGFIGGCISERFLQAGYQVTIVDALFCNTYEPTYFCNGYPQATVITATVANYFRHIVGRNSFDIVVHTASPVGPVALIPQAGRIGSEIVESTHHTIEHCAKTGAALIFLSSAEVYGISGTLSESMDVRVCTKYSPRIEYALGKLTSESMVVNSRNRGLEAVCVRPFNVVGARQNRAAGFVVPTFVHQALTGRPLTVFGTGSQQRTFVAVEDVAEFVFAYALDAIAEGYPVVNVGNPENASSIYALALRVIDLLGSVSNVVFEDGSRVHGPLYTEAQSVIKLPDARLAINLGWNPTRSLDNIINAAATFSRENRSCATIDELDVVS